MSTALVIEDEPQVAKMTADFLTQSGMERVKIAATEQEAFSIIQAEPVALLLLDLYLPGTSGLDILRKLRQEKKPVEAIIVSAAKDSMQIREAFRLGCVDYIIKPFTFERLAEALEKFRLRTRLLQKDNLNQQEVDFLAAGQENKASAIEETMPKGIDRTTLRGICCALLQEEGPFYVKDLSDSLHLSRVTVKKYLDFLSKEKILRKSYIYGNVGRPLNAYHLEKNPALRRKLEGFCA